MHPRNRHQGRYDLARLAKASPDFAPFIKRSPLTKEPTIDFADPAAVVALNRALLLEYYGVSDGRVPEGYLCAPVPGRADYIHYAADLLASSNEGVIPKGAAVRVLDNGVGASCIYPIIGHREYGWSFVGTDVDRTALESAQKIARTSPALAAAVELRLQGRRSWVMEGVIDPDERFDLSLCNPPFHASAEAARESGRDKRAGLGQRPDAARNFGGGDSELWFPGGEDAFVRRMISESARVPETVLWFTALVSKKDHLAGLLKAIKRTGADDSRTVEMERGQKKSRFIAWTFLELERHAQWRRER